MQVKTFFHENTNTFCYVVFDSTSKDALVIDPVLDFDPPSGSISFLFLDEVSKFIKNHQLNNP